MPDFVQSSVGRRHFVCKAWLFALAISSFNPNTVQRTWDKLPASVLPTIFSLSIGASGDKHELFKATPEGNPAGLAVGLAS